MSDGRLFGKSPFKDGNALRAVARTRERNPEISFAVEQVIVEVDKQIRAGDRDDFALPFLAQQVVQGVANVIGCAGSDEIDCGALAARKLYTGGREKGANLGQLRMNEIPCADPGGRLLRDFLRRMNNSKLFLFRRR